MRESRFVHIPIDILPTTYYTSSFSFSIYLLLSLSVLFCSLHCIVLRLVLVHYFFFFKEKIIKVLGNLFVTVDESEFSLSLFGYYIFIFINILRKDIGDRHRYSDTKLFIAETTEHYWGNVT